MHTSLLCFGIGACNPDATHEKRLGVRLHTLSTCPVPQNAKVSLQAAGDFAPNLQATREFSLNERGVEIPFPDNTTWISARVESDDVSFVGLSAINATRGFDILLWPEGAPCLLYEAPTRGAYPVLGGGQALGYNAAIGQMLLAGSDNRTSSAIVEALTFDTRQGTTQLIDARSRAVLNEPRSFASVAGLGQELVVSGGEHPIHEPTRPASQLRSSLEYFSAKGPGFRADLGGLLEPRTRHRALNLQNGEVLLVGGRGADGQALTLTEVVAAGWGRSRVAGTPLETGRVNPTAFVLDEGRVVVAGGVSSADEPVSSVEWFSADGAEAAAVPITLPARYDRAFAAMPGGGVLAVGGCEKREPQAEDDARRCKSWCRRGCPPQAGFDAFWLAPNGRAARIALPMPVPYAVLLPAADGQAWLFAPDLSEAGRAERGAAVYRFDPWHAQFVAWGFVPDFDFDPALPAPLQIDSGAFIWLTENSGAAQIWGMRFATRHVKSADTALVATRDSGMPGVPLHLVPDQPPEPHISYAGALQFDGIPDAETLPTVWLSDALLLDFEAEMLVSGAMPALRWSKSVRATCSVAVAEGASTRVKILRRGVTLQLSSALETKICNVPEGELPFGMQPVIGTRSTLHLLEIRRITRL